MEDMKDSKFEGDRIVRSSLYKCPVLLPLSCRDRKEMFGFCLKAEGPCAWGIGVWRDPYISDMLRYIDSHSHVNDGTMKFGLYDGKGTDCMEHTWPACDILSHHLLAQHMEASPGMKVVSRTSPGQPHFKLVATPDDKAVAMFEVSPALFISGVAKIVKLGGDQVLKEQPFHVAPLMQLTKCDDGCWYGKEERVAMFAHKEIECNKTDRLGSYIWCILKPASKTSGTPTMAKLGKWLKTTGICIIPVIVFLARHGWAPVRNHSFYNSEHMRFYTNQPWFCCWTPWAGYTVHTRCHETTFVTLVPGEQSVSYAYLPSPNAGQTPEPDAIYPHTTKPGITFKYRTDGKWICDKCGSAYMHTGHQGGSMAKHKCKATVAK